jgi:hypothetical protein
MRVRAWARNIVALAFVSLAAAVFFHPSAIAGVHARAHGGAFWLIVSVLASGMAAKLTFPVTLFGARFEIGAPAFALLALPIFVRFVVRDAFARAAFSWVVWRSEPAAPPAPPRGAPYALPSRVAVALAAAARARK